MHLLLKVIGWKCWCSSTSRIFNDSKGDYVRCLECGRRMPYDWEGLGAFDSPLQTDYPLGNDERRETKRFWALQRTA